MSYRPIEEMEFFSLFERTARWAWVNASAWPPFARDTVGKQLVRATDSINANLVEGDGRATDRDALHFFTIARASAREAELWLNRTKERGLAPSEELDAEIMALKRAQRLLNNLIAYRRRQLTIREERIPYGVPTYVTRSEEGMEGA